MTESERVGDAVVWLFAFFSAHHKLHDQPPRQSRFKGMLLIIAIFLLLLWGAGFAFKIAGALIHVILVVALVVFILHFARS